VTSLYTLLITSAAERDIRNLDWSIADLVNDKIAELATTPRPHGCKKLVNSDAWRIRIRDYRVLYFIDEQKRTITVAAVRHRREVYD
jgi:mRNA interferase RelE/StbE